VLDFHDTLGFDSSPHVAGISLGGWVALECARQGRAASVTGLCTAGFWREPLGPRRNFARAAARVVAPIAPLLMRPEGMRRRALASQIRHTERMTAAEAAGIIRGYAWADGYVESSTLMRGNVVGDISAIDVPVTLAWAEYDTLVRRKPLNALPASVRQLVLPDCGHIPTWDAPELVTRVIRETAGTLSLHP
jgi:pimeloyl-ACP methyl ester carboxylesterase